MAEALMSHCYLGSAPEFTGVLGRKEVCSHWLVHFLCEGPQSKDFVAYSYLVLFVFTIFKNVKPFIVGAVYIKQALKQGIVC